MVETVAHYKLLERVGSSAIGETFRARDTKLGRTSAITLVAGRIADDPEGRLRFVEDARAASRLSHPNAAAIYEVIEEQDGLFLASEFVPGETLARLIAGRSVNARRAIDYSVQLADALAEAHAIGLANLRLGTSTIVITPKGVAKVVGLGLGSWMGNVIDDTLDAAADDLESLGMVVFEMIAGRPYSATGTQHPSGINREAPREIDPIVARLLHRTADEPYESPAVVSAHLRAVGEELDGRAKPVARPGPSSSQRRNRVLVSLLISAALLLTGVLTWFAWR